MPMPQLTYGLEERIKLRQQTECHKCKEPCRYIYQDMVWCRTCLDCEQYPQLAHLTQEEREAGRLTALRRETKVSLVNADNLSRIGFK
jgi:MinD superfamily P-loop ATPase